MIVDILAIEADIVEPAAVPGRSARDAKDLPVLGTFLAARADYLVTDDNYLLAPPRTGTPSSPLPSSGTATGRRGDCVPASGH